MNDALFINRFTAPITTGTPVGTVETTRTVKTDGDNDTSDFKQILQEHMNNISGANFSKHAINRVVERNIDVSDSNLERLNEGIKLAEEKGLDETLILIDSNAYIVNVKNNTVITTVCNEELKGNVFTNIDGTVII